MPKQIIKTYSGIYIYTHTLAVLSQVSNDTCLNAIYTFFTIIFHKSFSLKILVDFLAPSCGPVESWFRIVSPIITAGIMIVFTQVSKTSLSTF